MADRLITRTEAGRLAGLNHKTIRRRISDGYIAEEVPKGLNAPKVSKNSLDDFMAFIWPSQQANRTYRGMGGVANTDPTAHAYLYEICDPKDGEAIYVGYTINLKSRWADHKRRLHQGKHGNRQLQRVFNKRGEPFVFKVIADGASALMLAREVAAIAAVRDKIGQRVCNATAGGEGTPGMAQHVRDKIARKSREAWQRPGYRERWLEGVGGTVGVCTRCGEDFIGRATKVYCSESCKRAMKQARIRDRKRSTEAWFR